MTDDIDLAAEVRALRAEVAALGEQLRVVQVGPTDAPRSTVTLEGVDLLAARLRDRLARREEELARTTELLKEAQRGLSRAETRRTQLLSSRAWRYGSRVDGVLTRMVRTAKSVYGGLLAVLPGPASSALRRLIARAKGTGPSRAASPTTAAPARTGGPVIDIPTLGQPAAHADRRLPSALVVCLGLDEAALTEVVELLRTRATELGAVRALVVTDCDAFHVMRAHRLQFEYLPPASAWERHRFAMPYAEFRAARMTELVRVYAPDRVLHVREPADLAALPASLLTAT